MKKVILLFLCVVSLATSSFSQETPKQDIATVRAKNLEQIVAASKTVGLDDKQIEKVKATIEELYKKQDAINNDTSLTPEDKKQKLKEANDNKDWKIRNLMGEKYMQYVEARKKLMAEAAAKKQ